MKNYLFPSIRDWICCINASLFYAILTFFLFSLIIIHWFSVVYKQWRNTIIVIGTIYLVAKVIFFSKKNCFLFTYVCFLVNFLIIQLFEFLLYYLWNRDYMLSYCLKELDLFIWIITENKRKLNLSPNQESTLLLMCFLMYKNINILYVRKELVLYM